MKVIILSAGMGKRLGQNIPKALLKIFQNKTILDFQLERISKKIGIKNIIIVVGYKKEEIISRYDGLCFVENRDFEITNTSKSLLKGLQNLEEDVIWMNGDVYFQEEVLDLLLKSNSSCCLVDNKKCGEEEIKFSVKNKVIYEISKSVKNPVGEALGVNKIKKKDLPYFKEELEKLKNEDFFEKAIENLTKRNKIQFFPIDIKDYFCMEIDYQEDLEKIKKYVAYKRRPR